MGRKPDTPQMQAAKGNPGKRMTKAERAVAESARIAELIAAAPAESSDSFAPPAMLEDERFAPALRVWRELVPELRALNILSTLDRQAFAVFCVAVGDYWQAVDDIRTRGMTYMATTHSGNKMLRVNPAVSVKERLGKFIFDASAEFGLTPLRRYNLMREMAAHGGMPNPNAGAHRPADEPASVARDDDDLIGRATRLDSTPPQTLQ